MNFPQALIVWDLRKIENKGCSFDVGLGQALTNLVRKYCDATVTQLAFCSPGNLAQSDLNFLQQLDFKISFIEDSIDGNEFIGISNHILLWLWDVERDRKRSSSDSLVFLFSKDSHLRNLAKPLEERNVIPLIFSSDNPSEWENLCMEQLRNDFPESSDKNFENDVQIFNDNRTSPSFENYHQDFDNQFGVLGRFSREFSPPGKSSTINHLNNDKDIMTTHFVDPYMMDTARPTIFDKASSTHPFTLAYRGENAAAKGEVHKASYANAPIKEGHSHNFNAFSSMDSLLSAHQDYARTTASGYHKYISPNEEHSIGSLPLPPPPPFRSHSAIPVVFRHQVEMERIQRQLNKGMKPLHYQSNLRFVDDIDRNIKYSPQSRDMDFDALKANGNGHGRIVNKFGESYSPPSSSVSSYPSSHLILDDEDYGNYSYDAPQRHPHHLPHPPPPPHQYAHNISSSEAPHQFSNDEKELVDELGMAINTADVQLTVSTLRKIYTKQYRDFRIPLLLKGLNPETFDKLQGEEQILAMVNSASFTLSCIQWCIGAQKKSNAVSFKYKMNKKISHWLLNEQMRKGMPAFCVPELSELAISVAENILKNAAELDFTLEILEACRTFKAIEIILPYAELWLTSDDEALVMKAKTFIQSRGNNLLNGEGINNNNGEEYSYHNDNKKLSAADVAKLNQTIAEHQALAVEAQTEGASVTSRLFVLLQSYPNGILGSRIPIIFRDKFGEALRLRGLKLKDLMLAINGVEIIGKDGPGDKVFRLKPIPYY